MHERRKTIDFFESELIKNKTRNFLIFGGEKTGKSQIALELLKLSSNPVINIFANDKNYKKYISKNIQCNHLSLSKLKNYIDNQTKFNEMWGSIILDECLTDIAIKSKQLYKWLSLNRIPRISYIICSNEIYKFPASERYNFDWVCVCSGLTRKQHEKIFTQYGMCFRNFNDYYNLMMQIENKPLGTCAIIFKNVYDNDFTKPGPYFLPLKQNYKIKFQKEVIQNINDKIDCAICLEELTNNDKVILECRHTFHVNCIKEWFKNNNTCPFCRKVVNTNVVPSAPPLTP